MQMKRMAGPEVPIEPYNLYGFILYDELDDDTAEFMNKHGGWISSVTGEDCFLMIFENPEFWGEYWDEKAKEIYGYRYDAIMAEWKVRGHSYRNMSHKIANKLNVSTAIFPCIVFVESIQSRTCSKPYPLINDKQFYRELFSAIHDAAEEQPISLMKLDKKLIEALNIRWYIPEKIGKRVELFNKYTSPILSIVERFVAVIAQIKP